MTDIKWEEPPTDKRTNDRGQFADELRANPGKWAKVAVGASGASLANQIKTGRSKIYLPAGSFEALSRRNPDGGYDIYARFVGDTESASA